MEDRMSGIVGRTFVVILLCGSCVLAGIAYGQAVNVNSPTAGSTAKTEKGVTVNGSNSTAGVETHAPDRGQIRADNAPAAKGKAVIVPRQGPSGAGGMAPLNGDESGVAPRADTANATGPQGQAIRSADSTAHQTVYDPNNQLGTSVQGKTQPVTRAHGQRVQTPN
jgi:hypothetical protein